MMIPISQQWSEIAALSHPRKLLFALIVVFSFLSDEPGTIAWSKACLLGEKPAPNSTPTSYYIETNHVNSLKVILRLPLIQKAHLSSKHWKTSLMVA